EAEVASHPLAADETIHEAERIKLPQGMSASAASFSPARRIISAFSPVAHHRDSSSLSSRSMHVSTIIEKPNRDDKYSIRRQPIPPPSRCGAAPKTSSSTFRYNLANSVASRLPG